MLHVWADGLAACSVAGGEAGSGFYLAAPRVKASSTYPPMSCALCERSTNAVVTDKGNGYYLVSYTPRGRGVYSIFG